MQGTIETTTDNIHKGLGYSVSASGSLSASASVKLLGRTGAIPVHFHGFEIKATQGVFTMELIELPTVSNVGTPITPYNLNRASTNTSQMKVYSGAITSGGTVIYTDKILDIGGGAHTQGGNAGVISEWVLKPNSDYIITLTNNATSSTEWVGAFYFYESAL